MLIRADAHPQMDALKGIGHACGHNLIAIAGKASSVGSQKINIVFVLGIAMACAIKAALQKHDIPGKICLLGTPGEST